MTGRGLTWLLLAVLVVLVLLAGGSAVLAKVGSLPDAVERAVGSTAGGRQSASQISSTEFAGADLGTAKASLRALVGEPEAKATHEVEGLRLECWYYGAGSKTGAYQFCFQNGRLRSKIEYRS
jgi:hypothetical protein